MSRIAVPLGALLVLSFGVAFAQGQETTASDDVVPAYGTEEDLRSAAQDLFDDILPAAPPADKAEAARRELGAKLFFDPRMSSSGLFSCQSCHNVGMGGVDAPPTSVGHGWQKGPRNAPTVYNALSMTPSSGTAAPPTLRSRPWSRSRPRSR